MQTAESEDALLEKGKAEEKAYNWVEAAKLYEQVAESFLGKKSMEEAAEVYRLLGYAHSRAARTAETAEEYKERHEKAINAYKKAVDLFKQTKNKPKELECEGLAFYVTSISSTSLTKAKDTISKSLELLIQASKFYAKEKDEESIARASCQAATNSRILLTFSSKQDEALEVSQRGIEISIKARKISKKIKHFQYYAVALSSEVILVDQTLQKKNREHAKRLLFKCEKYVRFIEDSHDFYVLANVYCAVGMCYGRLGVVFAESEKEQSEYFNKSISFLEKSEEFARKSKDNFLLVRTVYYLQCIIEESGRYEYGIKRYGQAWSGPMFLKFSRIFKNTINPWNSITNFLITLWYRVVATDYSIGASPDSRKLSAEKGIQYARKTLGMTSFTPTCAYLYQQLTICYIILAKHAKVKNERDEFAKKMLQFAKEAEQVGKNYNDGYPPVFSPQLSYSYALLICLKTQAETTENKDEKFKYLKEAATILKKIIISFKDIYITPNPWASFELDYNLGIIYYQIGILTNDNSFLGKAKEIFLDVIKETFKTETVIPRIYAYEHIAVIEDRIGNYIASAEYYEKVQMCYTELLKTTEDGYSIEMNKLYIKLNEGNKLLEKAKAYHKIEDHLKAKECNIKASKKLKELSLLPTAAYEATYYNAWALLEEAEFLSKQESLEEAIKTYERAKMKFQNTLNNLKQSPKEKLSINFITTLEKVAKTRIDYCSARIGLEKARILGKEGRHLEAAGIFASTASQFKTLCEVYKIEREHKNLEAIFYLCRAWEHMELAEEYIDSERYAKAAKHFTMASGLFSKTKDKFLASGTSAYCLALELGCKFDKSYDIEVKAQLYPKIKSILRNAANMYEKGGFKGAADWALATSTNFDAAWHLIKADEELEIIQKREIMGVASRYLKSASELFSKAGYPNKEREIQERLERVKKEDEIHISALNSITKPDISTSTVSISAPACPLETSYSPRVEEMLQLIQEERTIAKAAVEPQELSDEEPIVLLIISEGGELIFSYSFMKELKFEDEMLGSFLSGFNSFSDELFSEGLDRAKFGTYSVLMEPVSNFTVCYLFKGQVFLAKQKLSHLTEQIQNDASILQILHKFHKTCQVVELKDIPFLEILITEIFVTHPLERKEKE